MAMIFGALIAGTATGIAAALIAVLAFGLPVWTGLLAWWGIGTIFTLLPVLALALREKEEAAIPEGFVVA